MMARVICVLWVVMLLAQGVTAQDAEFIVPESIREPGPVHENPGGISYDQMLEILSDTPGGVPLPPDTVQTTMPGGAAPTAGLGYIAPEELRLELGHALYEDHIIALDYNRRVFEWQMVSTKVSFWVVIGLVGIGVFFAAIQFRRAMGATGAGENMTTDIEISGNGLKVSSPVLGVVILAISLGFFYLYLRHVYPIEHVRGAPEAAQSAEPAE